MNLFLLLVIVISFGLSDFRLIFLISFMIGLLYDLWFGHLTGMTSLVFLGFSFLVYLYYRRFRVSHFLFQLGFVLLADRLFALIYKQKWGLENALYLLALSLIIFFLLNKIKSKRSGLEIKV